METGWTNEPPDAEAPAAGGFTAFLAGHRQDPAEGRTLEAVLARAHRDRDPEPEPRDPDEAAANLLARGYSPGAMSQLSARLAETQAELASERERIERGQRLQQRVQRDHQAGRITVPDIMRMDIDEGDPGRVAQLERRAASLRGQLADAAAVIAPSREQLPADPLEAASRTAHDVFVQVTRQRMAAAAAGRAPRARRPFGSISRGAEAVRSEHCVHCTEAGVDDETAFLLHSDPEHPLPVTPPQETVFR